MLMMLVALFVCPFVANAAAVDVLYAGYCEGAAGTTSNIQFDYDDDGISQVSACTRLDADIMSPYVGNQIGGVRYNLISKLTIDSVTVWVRNALDGANLAQKTVARKALAKGWNYTAFDTPVAIDGNACYVGYTYYQSRTATVIATADLTHEGGMYLKAEDGSWEASTDVLAVECGITGSNLPQYDALIQEVSLSKDKVKMGQRIGVYGMVKNVACQPFSALTVTCTSAGMSPMTFNVALDREVSYRESDTFAFDFLPDYSAATSDINVTVSIDSEDGHADEVASNSKVSDLAYSVVANTFARKTVIEDFTSEGCAYCPAAAERIETMLADSKYSTSVIPIAHHAGVATDNFTLTTVDPVLANYFGISSSPIFLYNRTVFDGEYKFVPSDVAEIKEAMDYCNAQPADIEVNAFATVDKTAGTVTVRVSGDVASDFADNAPHITVYLLENNVPAISQIDQTGKQIDGYLHQHVTRAANSCWGEALTIEGGAYDYSYTFTLDNSWDYNNLTAVAFVNQYGDAYTARQIYNADQIALKYVGAYEAASDDVLVGDVNNDGVINISDVTALIDLILGDGEIASDMFKRADVNGDGVINISDVTALIDLILK